MNKLKPCPICGSEATYIFQPESAGGYFPEHHHARCSNIECPVENMSMTEGSMEELVQNWNCRAGDAEVARLTAELAAAKAEIERLLIGISR